ncbi:hypothetical protein BG015_001221 [Linnemannia schmuckeri]|uniref:Mitochondrial cardiolipin hydrolase n=1 Tax=Linnemannia schmuckeri TaxID=64567 RepID=A0A9P5RQI4_9FUNG|nr:hypothetical protein BG015_001221 [Linnemannia schmuckeri]
MSGLILNCLLPFVRPPRTVSVQEAQNMSTADYLDATFNSAPSIVNDQTIRQSLVGVFEQQAQKNDSAPSIQQLFNAARAACAVDHDKDVITWLETLLNASNYGSNGNHGNGGHVVTPPPVTPPTNNSNNQGGSNIFINPIFFPSEESFKQLIKTLDGAKKSLDICVYTITDDHLANAIIRAHERGVKVRIISDSEKAEDLGSDVIRLRDNNDIPTRVDNSKSFMHHKFAVIDDQLVINGSYNWTKGARFENKENLTLTNSPKAVQGFKGEFERLWAEFA